MALSYNFSLPEGDGKETMGKPEVSEAQDIVPRDPKNWGRPALPKQGPRSAAKERGFVLGD